MFKVGYFPTSSHANLLAALPLNKITYWDNRLHNHNKIKAYGQLVLLGFVVTNFTPVAYQRHRL